MKEYNLMNLWFVALCVFIIIIIFVIIRSNQLVKSIVKVTDVINLDNTVSSSQPNSISTLQFRIVEFDAITPAYSINWNDCMKQEINTTYGNPLIVTDDNTSFRPNSNYAKIERFNGYGSDAIELVEKRTGYITSVFHKHSYYKYNLLTYNNDKAYAYGFKHGKKFIARIISNDVGTLITYV